MDNFMEERRKLNEVVMKYADINIKRFFNLDGRVYEDGVLPRKIKELMGLVASLVMRCDDCIRYHLIKCYDEGISDEELREAMAIALMVGGSITIPHAFKMWDDLKAH